MAAFQTERSEYDKVISASHSQVDEHQFKRGWEASHSMSMEQAIEHALEAADAVRRYTGTGSR